MTSKHRALSRESRKRSWPLLVGAGAVSAVLLSLSVSGTLASWTSAVINNSANTVATAQAVILQEVSGANTCVSSTGTDNTFTCTTINKYGGTATPLNPGGSQVTTVTFANAGAANASSFALSPGTCSSTPTTVTGTPTANNLCVTAGELTVGISCSKGATYTSANAWTDLAYSASVAPTTAKTHAASAGDLNSAAQWTCQITVALSATASVLDQGVTVSQPITWTLTK